MPICGKICGELNFGWAGGGGGGPGRNLKSIPPAGWMCHNMSCNTEV